MRLLPGPSRREHLKMMRLLFLCLLLLRAAVSLETEGSADIDEDDEDYVTAATRNPNLQMVENDTRSFVDKTTGEEENSSAPVTLIIIVVLATVVSLAVAAIITVTLVKRHMKQQGIYSVPTEQDQKGAV